MEDRSRKLVKSFPLQHHGQVEHPLGQKFCSLWAEMDVRLEGPRIFVKKIKFDLLTLLLPESWLLVQIQKIAPVFLRGQPFQPWMKILDDFIHILVLGIGNDTSDDNFETGDILGILNEIAIPAKENIRSICWAMFLWPEIISLVNRVIVKYHFPL